MLVKLAALGALGYVGYRYLQNAQAGQDNRPTAPRQIALAGGPLSANARIQSDPESPPSDGASLHPASSTMGTAH